MSQQEFMSVPEPPPQQWRFDPHLSYGEAAGLALAASLAAASALYGLGKRHGRADAEPDINDLKHENSELRMQVMLAEQKGATAPQVLLVRDAGLPSTPPGSIVDVGPMPPPPTPDPPKRRSQRKKSKKS